MSEVRIMWAKFADGTTTCNWHRDANGFCLLTNRCWAGKPCPKTPGWANRFRDQLVDEAAAQREKGAA